jgi:hypothetical protein
LVYHGESGNPMRIGFGFCHDVPHGPTPAGERIGNQ